MTTHIRNIGPFAATGAILLIAALAVSALSSKPTSSQLLIQTPPTQNFG